MSNGHLIVKYDEPPENWMRKWILSFQLFYGVVSLIFMSFIIVHLMISTKYENSFYRLVQVDLMLNITCWLNTWISVRSLDLKVGITYLKFLENILPGIWNISAFLANFFFHLQFCSAATMSVHRISSILFFTHYEKFWSRWYPLINLFLVGYSCLSQVEGQPVRLDLINGSVYLDSNLELWYATNNRLFVFSVVYFVVILLLGLIVARMAFKKLQGTNADQGVSRKLTKIALTYGLVYSGILFWNIANMIQVRMNIMPVFALKIGNALMGLASDMMTLSLPYILLIFDSNIKRDIRFSRESSSVNPAVPSIY